MTSDESKRFSATLMALRGVIMIAAGGLAFMYPREALKFALLAGGGLLLVDGLLGLATNNLPGPQRGPGSWFALARNLFCIVAGLTVLASGALRGVFSPGFLAGFVGLLVLLAGLVEIGSILADRKRYSSPLTAMLSGALYAVFGLVLLFVPLSTATTLVQVLTVLIVLYGVSLLYRAWQIRAVR